MQDVQSNPIFQINADRCPSCRHLFTDCAAITKDKRPGPGDYTVCAGCTAVLRFGAGMKLSVVAWNDIPQQLRYTIGRVRLAADCVRAYATSGLVN